MHPDSQELDLIHQTPVGKSDFSSQKTRATVSPEREADASSPFSQDIACSPSFVDSEDSVPALGQSGSPSPTSRRVFFLSDVALDNSVPATPTTDIFEDAQVDNISDTPSRYRRIHSTPYPKPRLPLQLTPHPQARVVSLPQWTQSRDPFLVAMRNLRSVSSPARLKRAPLSPMYAETDETSLDISRSSSSPAPSFPALDTENRQTSELASPSQLLTSYSIPREQLYTAPEGFFFTPPSLKSLALSPPTTGPERSLPQDRPLAAIHENTSAYGREVNSEDEVSRMLQQTSLTSSRHARSSVAFSTTSRSSSPESVVFLSAAARIPRTFLGSTPKDQSTIPVSPSSNPVVEEPTKYGTTNDLYEGSLAGSRISRREICKGLGNIQTRTYADGKAQIDSSVVPSSATSRVDQDSDWIFFDPPQPIPALHGPASLPYARCPSGAEGVVLDDQQTPNRIVWGLPGKEADALSTNTHSSNQTKHSEPESNMGSSDFQPARDFRKSDSDIPSTKAVNTKATSFALAKGHLSVSQSELPALLTSTDTASPPNLKGKHVRFMDATTGSSSLKSTLRDRRPAVDLNTTTTQGSNCSAKPTPSDIARVLFDQVEKARLSEVKRPATFASRQETLDQLRRFGVPFRPHGLATPPNTTSPIFTSQFHLGPALVDAPPQVNAVAQKSGRSPTAEYVKDAPSSSWRTPSLRTQPSSVALPVPSNNLIPSSLSNVKSIPLLRLRERQCAEMASRCRDGRPSTENRLLFSRSIQAAVQEAPETSMPCSLIAESLSKTIPQSTPNDTVPVAPALNDKVLTNTSSDPSASNRRRPRKGGKRTQQDTSNTQSGPAVKENNRTAVNKDDTNGHKQPSRPGGRRRGPQRNRADSLPQSTSHA